MDYSNYTKLQTFLQSNTLSLCGECNSSRRLACNAAKHYINKTSNYSLSSCVSLKKYSRGERVLLIASIIIYERISTETCWNQAYRLKWRQLWRTMEVMAPLNGTNGEKWQNRVEAIEFFNSILLVVLRKHGKDSGKLFFLSGWGENVIKFTSLF